MKIKHNQIPIKQTALYQIYQGQNQKKIKFFVQLFPRKTLQNYEIDQNIQYNMSALKELEESIFPQSFLKIQATHSQHEFYKIISQVYEVNLSQYLQQNELTQKQALEIFSYVLKAVYSLILIGIKPVNIRPDHFVKVKNKWKMRCLVMNCDLKKTKGILSQYMWDPSYQAPQQYINNGKFQLQDQDLKLVVWNLGSILLDLLTSNHILKNQQIIKQFQNKQFSFNLYKGKRKNQISEQTKKTVSQMLHYDPKKRMVIQKIFQNKNLSLQVYQHFESVAQGSADISMQQIQLKMTQKLSQSVKNSLIKSKISSIKSEQSKEEPPKSFQKKIKENLEIKVMDQIINKKDDQILEDDFIMNSLDLISNKIKKAQKKHVTFNQNIVTNQLSSESLQSQMLPKEESFFQNEKFRKIFQIYKTYLDRSQLLFVTSHKFSQIPFQVQSDEIVLLSKYAVYFVGLLNLNVIVSAINHNKNIYKIQSALFSQFIQSIQYKSFKMYVGSIFQRKQNIFERLRLEIEELSQKKKNLLNVKQINEFVFDFNFRVKQFNQVKVPYRKILKKSYDCITKIYNLRKQEAVGRLGIYVVCCMTVDKLYQQNDIQKNFGYFFQWMQKAPSKYISLALFQKYLNQANVNILIKHARYILETYFNV